MRTNQQTTLKTSVTLTGIGVHSGNPAEITLHPAKANHGFPRIPFSGGGMRKSVRCLKPLRALAVIDRPRLLSFRKRV
jgi:UDP-3-O-acyl-N-acetylglucosamine deacetylase